MQTVDILWLVEHVDREFDVACAVTHLLAARHGIRAEVRHIYRDAAACLEGMSPRLVVHPFFYYAQGALATEDFTRAWPDAVHFNLAWEELFYPANAAVKAPSDDFARDRVLHHAWGEFFRDYLAKAGVDPARVFVNGNPAYGLYREPYRRFYKDRASLAAAHGLDPDRCWVFIPENYRWAFVSEAKIRGLAAKGGRVEDFLLLRQFCIESLAEVLRWSEEAAGRSDCEIIFRPRPATHSAAMAEFHRQAVGKADPTLRFIKQESVREWILASDLVLSSISTSLIEAAVAGKPACILAPLPIPGPLYCDWYDLPPRLTTREDFQAACTGELQFPGRHALGEWAEREMLSRGDPIAGLAGILARLFAALPMAPAPAGPPDWIGEIRDKRYFNDATHEKDAFGQAEVLHRTTAWAAVLDGPAARSAAGEARP